MNTVPTEELPGWGRRGEEFLVVVLNYYISSQVYFGKYLGDLTFLICEPVECRLGSHPASCPLDCATLRYLTSPVLVRVSERLSVKGLVQSLTFSKLWVNVNCFFNSISIIVRSSLLVILNVFCNGEGSVFVKLYACLSVECLTVFHRVPTVCSALGWDSMLGKCAQLLSFSSFQLS